MSLKKRGWSGPPAIEKKRRVSVVIGRFPVLLPIRFGFFFFGWRWGCVSSPDHQGVSWSKVFFFLSLLIAFGSVRTEAGGWAHSTFLPFFSYFYLVSCACRRRPRKKMRKKVCALTVRRRWRIGFWCWSARLGPQTLAHTLDYLPPPLSLLLLLQSALAFW